MRKMTQRSILFGAVGAVRGAPRRPMSVACPLSLRKLPWKRKSSFGRFVPEAAV